MENKSWQRKRSGGRFCVRKWKISWLIDTRWVSNKSAIFLFSSRLYLELLINCDFFNCYSSQRKIKKELKLEECWLSGKVSMSFSILISITSFFSTNKQEMKSSRKNFTVFTTQNTLFQCFCKIRWQILPRVPRLKSSVTNYHSLI